MNVVFVNAIVIAVLMLVVWSVSLIMRDASIVDIVWGLGFVVVAWSSWFASESSTVADLVVRLCVTVWEIGRAHV